MIRGLYSSANGLLVQSARTDAIAANLAGISVTGFRRDVPSVASFAWQLEHAAGGPAAGAARPIALLLPTTTIDLQPGPIRATGERCDLALEGPGFFSVQTPAGEAYTRSGAFRIAPTGQGSADGLLVTAAGYPLLGETGPIRIAGADVEVRPNGDVTVDGALIDRLKLVDLPPTVHIERMGSGLLRPVPGTAQPLARPVGAQIRQGYLEDANVNAMGELASMIAALRAFEASQRALQATDQTLDKAINEVGRV